MSGSGWNADIEYSYRGLALSGAINARSTDLDAQSNPSTTGEILMTAAMFSRWTSISPKRNCAKSKLIEIGKRNSKANQRERPAS
jgi:hypothetical protein